VRGCDARQAADQLAAAAMGSVQSERAHLRREAPGDVGHGLQQRQEAARPAHGFVGDRHDPARHQLAREIGGRGEVQVAEQHLPVAQPADLDRLRLLDLDDEVGRVGLGGGADDRRAGVAVGAVGKARRSPGAGLDADPMTGLRQLQRAFRRERDAVFMVLDFFGNADVHDGSRARLTRCSIAKAASRLKRTIA
jgi:hypothetical protein